MRIFAGVIAGILISLSCSGCAIKYTVYGKSGAPYVAPDLCAAVIACQKAGETQCVYPAIDRVTDSGTIVTETTTCKDLSLPAK